MGDSWMVEEDMELLPSLIHLLGKLRCVQSKPIDTRKSILLLFHIAFLMENDN